MKVVKKPGSKNAWRLVILFFAVLCAGIGGYILLLLSSPKVVEFTAKEWNGPPPTTDISENRLYIPKIKLNIAYATGGQEVLDDKAWHRFPERGDPEKGGNFILSGHRFELGLTPQQTIRKSPFYNIDQLQVDDDLFVDFNKRRYKYQIVEKFAVKPTQVEIEAPSDEAKLTLYTCTLGGEADGREVLIAKLVESKTEPTILE